MAIFYVILSDKGFVLRLARCIPFDKDKNNILRLTVFFFIYQPGKVATEK